MVYNQEFDHESHARKSKELLREWLSPSQLAEFDNIGCFQVNGSDGGKFRITPAAYYNVMWCSPDGVKLLCFTPYGMLPRHDCMLAQKIALETDEIGVLRMANVRVSTTGSAGLGWGGDSYRWNAAID